MLLKLHEIIKIIETWSPIKFSEDFDNIGLIVGDRNSEIKKALITIDTTEKVVEEALKKKCNLIISFHPIIFHGLKKLTEETYVERTVRKAIKNNINIYAIHTNLDNHPKGVNYMISKKIGLKKTSFLIPSKNPGTGMGMVGHIEKPMEEQDFLNFISKKMNSNFIKHSNFTGIQIKKIAVLGGSGSFAIGNALKENVNCFITSDLKYHDYFKSENKILLLDIGHYESEQFTKDVILDFLNKKIPKFACVKSNTITNPVNYINYGKKN